MISTAMVLFMVVFAALFFFAADQLIGWLISLVLIHVVNRQSFHWSMDLHLPWGDLAAFTAVMLAFSVLTALASGRRAMSREVVLAVKEDW